MRYDGNEFIVSIGAIIFIIGMSVIIGLALQALTDKNRGFIDTQCVCCDRNEDQRKYEQIKK